MAVARRPLGATGLEVFPLCLGANVFGWTADEQSSRAVLDAYADAGGNWVDTANSYGNWVQGNPPGRSESIIGAWMSDRGNRDALVVTTKVGANEGLSADAIRRSVAGSLERLRVDRLDLLYAHFDDPATPLEETLRAFDGLVREGAVANVGASNYSAERLAEALAISDREGLARFSVMQPHYNLVERDAFEGALQDLCAREGIPTAPYYALANGFLTGKYRRGAEVDSARSAAALEHLDARGERTLDALAEIADARATTIAAVALAWLAAQPTVAAPIASARTVEQIAGLLPMAALALDDDELARLAAAGSSA